MMMTSAGPLVSCATSPSCWRSAARNEGSVNSGGFAESGEVASRRSLHLTVNVYLPVSPVRSGHDAVQQVSRQLAGKFAHRDADPLHPPAAGEPHGAHVTAG